MTRSFGAISRVRARARVAKCTLCLALLDIAKNLLQTMNARKPTSSASRSDAPRGNGKHTTTPLPELLPQIIDSCEATLHELTRKASFVSDQYNAFTYSMGPMAKRPAAEWSHLAVQIQVPKGSARPYVYWRHFRATIKAGDRRVRVSSQISLQKGRLSYRPEALLAKAQPWERDRLLEAEKEFAEIRRQAKQVGDLLTLLNGIRESSLEKAA